MLRIILYLICFLSLSWIFLLFAGPTVIQWSIAKFSGGQLIATNVNVTPKLFIGLSNLRYIYDDEKLVAPTEVIIRSANVSWSIFRDQPFLVLDVGPTFLNNTQVLDSAKIYTSTFKDVNFTSPTFLAEINTFKYNKEITLNDLKLNFKVDTDSGVLHDLSFAFSDSKLGFNGDWSIGSAIGGADTLSLDRPIGQQALMLNILAEEINGERFKHTYRLSKLSLTLNVKRNFTEFVGKINDFYSEDTKGKIGSITAEGSISHKNFLKNATIDFYNGKFDNNVPNFSRITTDVSGSKAGDYNFEVNGEISKKDFTSSAMYIGTLPAAKLDLNFRVANSLSKIQGVSEIKFNASAKSDFSATVEFNLMSESAHSFMTCSIISCRFSEIDIGYTLIVDREWIKGRSRCTSEVCGLNQLENSLKTSDTVTLFTKLNNEKILNPVVSAYIYSIIASGRRHENGHETIF